ncbi:MAG: hypothetical protein Q8Q08_00725 [Candidatus Omnitrophota bacterium]|nr:hypothetical protein [Candidatus Omnitrophota bacterium]MDZ4242054.1 hypothetical protein [Candidatus Omnitrophota bacterium]
MQPDFLTISRIKLQAQPTDLFRTEGYVAQIYLCPPCAPGSLCKGCLPDMFVISETPKTVDDFEQVGPTELIVFARNGEKLDDLKLGGKYRFMVQVSDIKSTLQPINDVLLISRDYMGE